MRGACAHPARILASPLFAKANYSLIGCDPNKKLELHIDIRETDGLKILGVTFD